MLVSAGWAGLMNCEQSLPGRSKGSAPSSWALPVGTPPSNGTEEIKNIGQTIYTEIILKTTKQFLKTILKDKYSRKSYSFNKLNHGFVWAVQTLDHGWHGYWSELTTQEFSWNQQEMLSLKYWTDNTNINQNLKIFILDWS